MKRTLILPVLLLVLLLSACGTTDVEEPAATETAVAPTTVPPAATETPEDGYPAPPPVPAEPYPGEEAYPGAPEEAPPLEGYPGNETPVAVEESDMNVDPYPGASDVPERIYNMPMVQDMIQELSERQQVSPDAITIVSFEEVVWRDSSLGCPQPGMQYLQVLTDGFKVVMTIDGERFDYHAGGNNFILCE